MTARLRAGIAAAALAAALAAASSASAKIVLNVGAAGVRLGQSAGAVHARLGRPVLVRRASGGGRYEIYGGGLAVRIDQGRVSAIALSARGETVNGVGVGSTAAALRSRVHGVTCRSLRVTTLGIDRQCLTLARDGSAATNFMIARGRIFAIVIVDRPAEHRAGAPRR